MQSEFDFDHLDQDPADLVPQASDPGPPAVSPPVTANGIQLPGPGFLESIFWTFIAMMSQIVGSVIAVMVIMVLYVASSGLEPQELQRKLQEEKFLNELMTDYAGLNLGIIMVTFVVSIMLIVVLRLGSHRRRALPVQLPSPWHTFLTLLWVLPLAVFCSQLGLVANIGWDYITADMPGLKSLDDLNIMESIGDIISGMPPALVYLLIAVAPAISEELLFRVLIGRGLVARYGLVLGIGLTTILFAAVHLHPVHMVALLPLSVAIHISYLASRSLWIPMLAHFLNNAWAVSVMMSLDEEAAELAGENEFLPWWVTLAAGILSLVIGCIYWQSRLVWKNDGESDPTPEPYSSADRHHAGQSGQLGWSLPPIALLVALALSIGLFATSVAFFAQQQQL